MVQKFRAYDGGSLSRMYQPEDVMVGGGNIWITIIYTKSLAISTKIQNY